MLDGISIFTINIVAMRELGYSIMNKMVDKWENMYNNTSVGNNLCPGDVLKHRF